jgi:predicted DNA-binding transcriptional regulator
MEETFEKLGFSKNEAKVYIALIDLGPTSAVKVSNKAKVHRTNVYDALERLVKKGFVKYFTVGSTKMFEAADPVRILNEIKQREKEFGDLLPVLSAKYAATENKSVASIHRNVASIRSWLSRFLKLKQPLLVYGLPKITPELLGHSWLSHFHKERIREKIEMLHIYTGGAVGRIGFLNKMNYTEARSLPAEFDTPVSTQTCGDHVLIIHWQKDPLIIHIQDKNVADSYAKQFRFLWKIAKKYKKS